MSYNYYAKIMLYFEYSKLLRENLSLFHYYVAYAFTNKASFEQILPRCKEISIVQIYQVIFMQICLLLKTNILICQPSIETIDNQSKGIFKPVQGKIHQRKGKYPPPRK